MTESAKTRLASEPAKLGVVPCTPHGTSPLTPINVDLLEPASVERAVAPLTDVTHVIFGAYIEKQTPRERSDVNVALLRNLLDVVERNAPDLAHVTLYQGGKAYGADLGPFKTPVFAKSDDCPLTAQTKEMVNARRLSMMKPSSFLINTARGGLIDEPALAAALTRIIHRRDAEFEEKNRNELHSTIENHRGGDAQVAQITELFILFSLRPLRLRGDPEFSGLNSGQIASAGLDVLSAEPPPRGHLLLSARNCVITPHLAWAAQPARDRL